MHLLTLFLQIVSTSLPDREMRQIFRTYSTQGVLAFMIDYMTALKDVK